MSSEKNQHDYQIHVVLVRSLYARNIGATSRAMANMQAHKLILINPHCEVDYDAQQAAASGQTALQNRKVYASWDEFNQHEGNGYRLSFTARDGKGRAVQDYKSTLNWLLKRDDPESADARKNVYLIFGPEDAGLTLEDLSHSHISCSLPIYGNNTSLNLAQAVLLALFILRDNWGGEKTKLEGHAPDEKIFDEKGDPVPFNFPDQALQQWLTLMGFDINDRKVSAHSVLKKMFLHAIPTEKELGILQIVLHQGIRKLEEYNKLREEKGLPFISENK